MKTQAYYDEFAGWYERERGRGYHQLLDDLEIGLVERYGRGRRVLEAGCGTGLLLARAAAFAAAAHGFDLSAGMLGKARARGLDVVQASIDAIPYPDASFDVAYSFKVLPHVERIAAALAEMARVVRPGGHLILEFYNPTSLRGLVKRLKPPHAISERATDVEVFTRFDTLAAARGYLPAGTHVVQVRGIRIVTPAAALHRVPLVGAALGAAERALADLPGARRLGGFLAVVAEKA